MEKPELLIQVMQKSGETDEAKAIKFIALQAYECLHYALKHKLIKAYNQEGSTGLMIFARNDGAGQFSRELCFDHES
jgi:hypothetical protein